ncbi:MAG: shikimate dehydrogenase family protein, partial [Bryobacteraceae bacterium]
VNTVYRKAGRWRGTNTDADGIRIPLEKRVKLAKANVLIVGNGGTARSAAFTLKDAGAKIAITGRNIDRVRALAKLVDAEPLAPDRLNGRFFDVLIHATPLGMWPHTETCFFQGPIPAGVVFDLVYTPRETLLLKRAAAEGRQVIAGLEMFLEQAARQFEIFTGVSAPRAAMERAALEALQDQEEQLRLQSGKHGGSL